MSTINFTRVCVCMRWCTKADIPLFSYGVWVSYINSFMYWKDWWLWNNIDRFFFTSCVCSVLMHIFYFHFCLLSDPVDVDEKRMYTFGGYNIERVFFCDWTLKMKKKSFGKRRKFYEDFYGSYWWHVAVITKKFCAK